MVSLGYDDDRLTILEAEARLVREAAARDPGQSRSGQRTCGSQ